MSGAVTGAPRLAQRLDARLHLVAPLDVAVAMADGGAWALCGLSVRREGLKPQVSVPLCVDCLEIALEHAKAGRCL